MAWKIRGVSLGSSGPLDEILVITGSGVTNTVVLSKGSRCVGLSTGQAQRLFELLLEHGVINLPKQ